MKTLRRATTHHGLGMYTDQTLRLNNATEIESDEEIDDPYQLEEFNPGAKNQDSNKQIFRRNYGVETQLPAFYIIDAKVFPISSNFMIRVVDYVAPNIKDMKVRTLVPRKHDDDKYYFDH